MTRDPLHSLAPNSSRAKGIAKTLASHQHAARELGYLSFVAYLEQRPETEHLKAWSCLAIYGTYDAGCGIVEDPILEREASNFAEAEQALSNLRYAHFQD